MMLDITLFFEIGLHNIINDHLLQFIIPILVLSAEDTTFDIAAVSVWYLLLLTFYQLLLLCITYMHLFIYIIIFNSL